MHVAHITWTQGVRDWCLCTPCSRRVRAMRDRVSPCPVRDACTACVCTTLHVRGRVMFVCVCRVAQVTCVRVFYHVLLPRDQKTILFLRGVLLSLSACCCCGCCYDEVRASCFFLNFLWSKSRTRNRTKTQHSHPNPAQKHSQRNCVSHLPCFLGARTDARHTVSYQVDGQPESPVHFVGMRAFGSCLCVWMDETKHIARA